MSKERPSHLFAALQALFVTFLWSTSWVLVKVGLEDLPPFTFAGLRYGLAFLCLLPFALRPAHRQALRGLSARDWQRLTVLGLLFYAVTQGAQFFGLAYLPAATASLLFSLTAITVAVLSAFLLSERPTALQWLGILASMAGVAVYFFPLSLQETQAMGVFVVLVGVITSAGSSILSQRIHQEGSVPALVVTVIGIGVGAVVLLMTGMLTEPFPRLSLGHWAIIGWLAVVNTALAFMLWNHTRRLLTTVESTIIQSTMLAQIAALAWLFLREPLSVQQIVGLVLAGLGALVVQLRRPPVAPTP